MQKGAERLGAVAGLDLSHVGDISSVEELSTDEQVGKLGLGAENSLDAGRRRSIPVGTGDEKIAAAVAEAAGAQVSEVEGIEIDELAGVVALFLDFRHGHDDGLGAQVHPEIGVRCVGVGGDDELVFRCGDRAGIGQGVEGRAVVVAGGVDCLLVEGLVVDGQGKGIDVRFPGDGACILWRSTGGNVTRLAGILLRQHESSLKRTSLLERPLETSRYPRGARVSESNSAWRA